MKLAKRKPFCEFLRNWELRILANSYLWYLANLDKEIKNCERSICETLRNSYLRNLRNMYTAKHQSLKLLNLQKWVAQRIFDPKSQNNTVTTARLLQVAKPFYGKHLEMSQSATVARALCLLTESKGPVIGVVPFCQCLTLRPVTGTWLKRDCSRIICRIQWKSSQYWFHWGSCTDHGFWSAAQKIALRAGD